MKRVSVFLLAAIVLAACKNSDKKNGTGGPGGETTIQWLDSTFTDMGKVKDGDTVKVAFRFKNTGEHPLVIASASASCGCTKPEKPEEAVAPGDEGIIKASFDSKGRKGSNRKSIFVDMNTKPNRSHTLEFEVVVE